MRRSSLRSTIRFAATAAPSRASPSRRTVAEARVGSSVARCPLRGLGDQEQSADGGERAEVVEEDARRHVRSRWDPGEREREPPASLGGEPRSDDQRDPAARERQHGGDRACELDRLRQRRRPWSDASRRPLAGDAGRAGARSQRPAPSRIEGGSGGRSSPERSEDCLDGHLSLVGARFDPAAFQAGEVRAPGRAAACRSAASRLSCRSGARVWRTSLRATISSLRGRRVAPPRARAGRARRRCRSRSAPRRRVSRPRRRSGRRSRASVPQSITVRPWASRASASELAERVVVAAR